MTISSETTDTNNLGVIARTVAILKTDKDKAETKLQVLNVKLNALATEIAALNMEQKGRIEMINALEQMTMGGQSITPSATSGHLQLTTKFSEKNL
ncbi:MAG: hypothetical protein AAF329_01940 [Cyanobacteria bacterium P01_A01_bin.17]